MRCCRARSFPSADRPSPRSRRLPDTRVDPAVAQVPAVGQPEDMLRGKPESNKPLNQAETVDANLSEKMAWSAAQAKARLSEVIDLALRQGPQAIIRNTRPAVVVVSIEEWVRNTGRKGTNRARGALHDRCVPSCPASEDDPSLLRSLQAHGSGRRPARGLGPRSNLGHSTCPDHRDWLRRLRLLTRNKMAQGYDAVNAAPAKAGAHPSSAQQADRGSRLSPRIKSVGPRESAPVAVSYSVCRPSGRWATRDDGKILLRSNAPGGRARSTCEPRLVDRLEHRLRMGQASA
jgi:prevent-host-death family protein